MFKVIATLVLDVTNALPMGSVMIYGFGKILCSQRMPTISEARNY